MHRTQGHFDAMIEARCLQDEMIIWVDRVAVGQNNGGKYAALFSSRLEKRVLAVYEEKWSLFPDGLRPYIENAPHKNFEIPSNRAAAESMGITPIPSTELLRYKRTTKANADGKWVLHRVLRWNNSPPDTPTLLTSALESRYPDSTIRQAYMVKVLKRAEVKKISELTEDQCQKWLDTLNK